MNSCPGQAGLRIVLLLRACRSVCSSSRRFGLEDCRCFLLRFFPSWEIGVECRLGCGIVRIGWLREESLSRLEDGMAHTLFFLRRFLSGHVSGRIGSLWGWNPPVSALESSQQGCLVAERMVLGVRIAWLVSWSGLILGLFLASEPSSKDSQSADAVPFPGFVLASRCCARCLGL